MAQPSRRAKDALRSTSAAQGEAGPMYYVDLIKSRTYPSKTYVGFTQLEVVSRLAEHNAGRVPHTARHRPWDLVALVGVPDKHKALLLERYFKSGSGHAFAHKHLW